MQTYIDTFSAIYIRTEACLKLHSNAYGIHRFSCDILLLNKLVKQRVVLGPLLYPYVKLQACTQSKQEPGVRYIVVSKAEIYVKKKINGFDTVKPGAFYF